MAVDTCTMSDEITVLTQSKEDASLNKTSIKEIEVKHRDKTDSHYFQRVFTLFATSPSFSTK